MRTLRAFLEFLLRGSHWRLTKALSGGRIFDFDIGSRQPLHLTSFLDLVLAWNTGISYGLFQPGAGRRTMGLLALKVIAVVLLALWLARTGSRLSAVALGLIIGGAIGNAVDRLVHGAVMDFVLFRITAAAWSFQWYVFNLADVAIVAGVVGLLYEISVRRGCRKSALIRL